MKLLLGGSARADRTPEQFRKCASYPGAVFAEFLFAAGRICVSLLFLLSCCKYLICQVSLLSGLSGISWTCLCVWDLVVPSLGYQYYLIIAFRCGVLIVVLAGGGGGGNGEMANLTNEKANSPSPFFAIIRHFSPLVVFEIKHFRHEFLTYHVARPIIELKLAIFKT